MLFRRNSNHGSEVNAAGYNMRVQTFDVLTFEKYAEIDRGKRVARTWFVGLEIAGGPSIALECFTQLFAIRIFCVTPVQDHTH